MNYRLDTTNATAVVRPGCRGAAFGEVVDRVPAHALAHAALGMDVTGASGLSAVDAAIARAVMHVASGDRSGCDADATTIGGALAAAPPGNPGWLLPVEPMLNVAVRPDAWVGVLARLRTRAA